LLNDEEFDRKNCFEMVRDNLDRLDDEDKNGQKVNHILLHECFQEVVESVWYGSCSKISWLEYIFFIVITILPSPILLLIYFFTRVSVNLKIRQDFY
jgi:hypothetical protein